MIEAEQIMKRCQAGTRNYEEANNLHAACYGMIGKLLAQQEKDYERGFVDGMQKQMQSSVDKAVNRMAQPEQEPMAYLCAPDQHGLYSPPTADKACKDCFPVFYATAHMGAICKAIEAKLKEKNTRQDGDCKHCVNGCPACDARRQSNVLP